jgi:hypothetical protein
MSGIDADSRVVIGDLWRSSPGTKVTPRLTTPEASKGSRP